jgi:hypothetical protein
MVTNGTIVAHRAACESVYGSIASRSTVIPLASLCFRMAALWKALRDGKRRNGFNLLNRRRISCIVEVWQICVWNSFFVHRLTPNGDQERGVNLHLMFPIDAVGPAIEMTVTTLRSGLIMPVTRFIADRLLHWGRHFDAPASVMPRFLFRFRVAVAPKQRDRSSLDRRSVTSFPRNQPKSSVFPLETVTIEVCSLPRLLLILRPARNRSALQRLALLSGFSQPASGWANTHLHTMPLQLRGRRQSPPRSQFAWYRDDLDNRLVAFRTHSMTEILGQPIISVWLCGMRPLTGRSFQHGKK